MGTLEWMGDWADDSEQWNTRAISRLDYKPETDMNAKPDGIFWMNSTDLLQVRLLVPGLVSWLVTWLVTWSERWYSVPNLRWPLHRRLLALPLLGRLARCMWWSCRVRRRPRELASSLSHASRLPPRPPPRPQSAPCVHDRGSHSSAEMLLRRQKREQLQHQ